MRADNSRHLTVAAARRGQDTMARAQTAIQRMRQAQGPLTVAEFCRAARVSRSWLYTQPALLQELARARPAAGPEPAAERATDQSLLTRLQAAHQRNRELAAEITDLREQIAILYGRLRDDDLRGTATGGRAMRQAEPADHRPAPPRATAVPARTARRTKIRTITDGHLTRREKDLALLASGGETGW